MTPTSRHQTADVAADIPLRYQAARQMGLNVDVETPGSQPVHIDQALRKAELGQFWTPSHIAAYMASLFSLNPIEHIHLLDPGAGTGALTSAFVNAVRSSSETCNVSVETYEIDARVAVQLAQTLTELSLGDQHFNFQVIQADFVARGAELVRRGARPFSHVIMNPPYRKINSASRHRAQLRSAGIETVNLYSAFVALALELLRPGGQLVAIMPRSFCNGPYYRPVRERLLGQAAIRHIHLFATRDRAFRSDAVLQENVIVRLDRGAVQGNVLVSTSTDDLMSDYHEHSYTFDQIVQPGDQEQFIHIPSSPTQVAHNEYSGLSQTLKELGIDVSTGPVVDFRLREFLLRLPEPGSAPLLYPLHLNRGGTKWPATDAKKPNAIEINDQTRKWLMPRGNYTAVRRFSSKEERRRVVAGVVEASSFSGTEWLGFENHLNLFHYRKQGMALDTCFGLCTLLNSTPFDELFRRFNGHTQVNATDLRAMRYPPLETLQELGRWAKQNPSASQFQIDEVVLRAIR